MNRRRVKSLSNCLTGGAAQSHTAGVFAGTDQAGHVGKVPVPQRGDEVVHQPELGRLPVDVGRDEEEARLGAQHRVGRQQVLAGAALRAQHVGDAGGEAGQEDEERTQQRGDGVHGCSSAARHKQKHVVRSKTSSRTTRTPGLHPTERFFQLEQDVLLLPLCSGWTNASKF